MCAQNSPDNIENDPGKHSSHVVSDALVAPAISNSVRNVSQFVRFNMKKNAFWIVKVKNTSYGTRDNIEDVSKK